MNDIELLNNMLYQSLKQDIENLRDNAIYIPFITIACNVKIDRNIDVKITSIEPQTEYGMLIQYIAETLAENLKEEFEKSLREDFYKIVRKQIYIPSYLEIVHEFDTVIIDRKGITIGNMKGSLYLSKDQELPETILKAIKSYIINLYSIIREAVEKLIKEM